MGFVGRSFKDSVKIFNNINHCYRGKYIVKCILIGIKRISELPNKKVYSKMGQVINMKGDYEESANLQEEYDS